MPRDTRDDVVWYLRLEDTRIDGVTVLAAEGRVSNRTSSTLETALAQAIASATHGVVLDLSGTDYISSAGLRVIAKAAARLAAGGRALVMCGVQDAVRPALGLSELDRTVEIEPSREAAVARLLAAP